MGRLLAQRLGYGFLDLDEEIERRAKLSVSEIFRRGGEAEFRELEARATEAVDPPPRTVIATGGGWMARPSLRNRWSEAVSIWLRVRPETVLERIGPGGADRRPMLDLSEPEGSVRRLLAAREGVYRQARHAVPTDGRTPEEVVEEILERLGPGGGHREETDGEQEATRAAT